MRSQYFHPARNGIAVIIKISAILFATLAIFHQDLIILASEALQSELMSHTLAIPFLFVYFIYRKRKVLRATISIEPTKKPTYIFELVGVLLCLTAFLLYWHGSYTFYPLEYHVVSLPLFTSGLILIVFNTETLRVLAFPIAFLLFLTPPPSEITYIAGATVATFSSGVSYNILKTLGLPINLETVYGAPALVVTNPSGSSIQFVIGMACSGIHSLIGLSVFAAFLAYIARGTTWKKATLFFSGLPIIYALNIIRIIILVSIGYWQGADVAWDIFHIFGGWVLIFLGTLILLILSEKIWKIQIFTKKPKATPCQDCNPNTKNNESFCQTCGRFLRYSPINISKRDMGKIVALIIITSLIITISVPVFALTKGPPGLLVQSPGGEQVVSTRILPEMPNYTLQFVYRDQRFEDIAKLERALAYAYYLTDGSGKTIWVSLEIGSSRATWHSWEACVITWPQIHGRPYAIQLDLREVQLMQNPPLIGKFFAFQDKKSHQTQVVLYWYEGALFNTGSGSVQKYAKISLIVYHENPEGIPETEDLLLPFGKAIVNYWQPIKTWGPITLVLSYNAPIYVATTTALLITILTFLMIKNYQRKKANLEAYKKLSETDQKIIEAVYSKQKNKPTISEIATFYKRRTQKHIELETLIDKVNRAKEIGMLKQEITSRQDEPVLTWKAEILFS